MVIEVDSVSMTEKCGEIHALKQELQNTMDRIELLVLSVRGAWQGDAERAFSEKILSVKKQFSHIADFIDEYAELLCSFAFSYEQQEKDLSSKINLS